MAPTAQYLEQAIALARKHSHGGRNGPFGAVLVRRGELIAEGWNRVVESHDPTAHAEIVAIRRATARLQQHTLADCVLYSSCEPCPMCLSAIYWARIPIVYFAATGSDAAAIGFDDEAIRQFLVERRDGDGPRLVHINHPDSTLPFQEWMLNPRRQPY